MAILDTGWSVQTETIGAALSVGNADRYFALSLQDISNTLNSAGISQYAKITSVKLAATVYAKNSTWAEARLKIGYGSPDSINSNAILYPETKIHTMSTSGTIELTIDLSGAISNNGMSPFTLSTSSGTCVTFRIWSENMGKKVYSISDVYLDVAYEIPTYTITVGNGTVNGAPSGTFEAGTSVTLVPIAPTGYEFTEWSDGNTDNPRVVVVTGDQSYVARFKKSGPPFAEDTLVDGVLYVGTETTNIETDGYYQNRTDITSVVIPEGRANIGIYVLSNCGNLMSITIPQSVTFIAMGAFDDCYKLAEINYNGTKAQWNNNVYKDYVFGDLGLFTVRCTDGDVEYVWVDVDVSPAGTGTVTMSPTSVKNVYDADYYIKDTTITVTPTANIGYRFNHWSDYEDEFDLNPLVTTVTSDYLIKAVFTISKLYAGTSQAKAVYVGTTPAKAIYIGTTKIYEQ